MKQISPFWYTGAFLFALASIMVGTAVASHSWDSVRDSTPIPITRPVNAEGRSLAIFTDILQTDRRVTCRAKVGKKHVDIPKAQLAISIDDQGDQWHLIGLLPDGDNHMAVACTPRDRGVDDANYAYSVVDGFESRGNTGKGIAILGATIGAGGMAYVYYLRRQRRLLAQLDAETDAD